MFSFSVMLFPLPFTGLCFRLRRRKWDSKHIVDGGCLVGERLSAAGVCLQYDSYLICQDNFRSGNKENVQENIHKGFTWTSQDRSMLLEVEGCSIRRIHLLKSKLKNKNQFEICTCFRSCI